nr:unnamed protein product [Naegleria fowleri]
MTPSEPLQPQQPPPSGGSLLTPVPCPLPPPLEQCKYSFEEMDHSFFCVDPTSTSRDVSKSPYRSFYENMIHNKDLNSHSGQSLGTSSTPTLYNANQQNYQFPNMGVNYNTHTTMPSTMQNISFTNNNNTNNHLMNSMNPMMMMQNNLTSIRMENNPSSATTTTSPLGMPSSMFNSSFYGNSNNLNNNNIYNVNTSSGILGINNNFMTTSGHNFNSNNNFATTTSNISNYGNFNPMMASQPPPLSSSSFSTSTNSLVTTTLKKPVPYENGSIIDPEMENEIFELPLSLNYILQNYSSAAECVVSEEFNNAMMEEPNIDVTLKIMKWYDESKLKLGNEERAQWAVKTLDASSEYSTRWGSVNIAGPSRVYPKYGDFPEAWAPRLQQNSKEFFIVEFADYYKITGIQLYETFNPGAVTKISCLPRGKDRYTSRKLQLDGSIIGTTTFEARPEDWVVLYEGPTQQSSLAQHSRIFSPSLRNTGVESKIIYFEMDTTNSSSWSEIDAVKLIGIPVIVVM